MKFERNPNSQRHTQALSCMFISAARLAPVLSSVVRVETSAIMVLASSSSGAVGADLSWGWAKKMPKIKFEGVDAQRSETLRFALQKASSLLYSNPDLILETLAEIESKVAKTSQTRAPVDEPMFSGDKITTFRSVPDEWFASWLQAQTGGLLTDALLQKVLGKSHGQFERLKVFATQLPGSMSWSGDLLYKKVAARALDERARELGSPVSREWIKKAIDIIGNINWAHGCRCVGGVVRQIFRVGAWDWRVCQRVCSFGRLGLNICLFFLSASTDQNTVHPPKVATASSSKRRRPFASSTGRGRRSSSRRTATSTGHSRCTTTTRTAMPKLANRLASSSATNSMALIPRCGQASSERRSRGTS